MKTNDCMQNLNSLIQIEVFVQPSVKIMVNDKKAVSEDLEEKVRGINPIAKILVNDVREIDTKVLINKNDSSMQSIPTSFKENAHDLNTITLTSEIPSDLLKI